MAYLVVGGRGEAGQSAIEAVRNYDPEAEIFATSSGTSEIPGTKLVRGVDLGDSNSVDSVIHQLKEAGNPKIDVMFFTPAFGPIGYPISETPEEDVPEGLRFSYAPMVALADALLPRLTVGYSAFYWLAHTRAAYGAMAYAKIALDRLAARDSERFRVIRAGTFRSQATRGIGLLLFRKLRKTPYAELKKLGELFEASDKKFTEFFFDYAFQCEREAFGDRFSEPHRETNREDLKRCNAMLLEGDESPFINVIGDWVWKEDRMPELDESFALLSKLDHLIAKSVE